jgi:hypothetical protein
MRKSLIALLFAMGAAAAPLATARPAHAHWGYGGWWHHGWGYHRGGDRHWSYRGYAGWRRCGIAGGPIIENAIVAIPQYVFYPTAYYHYRDYGYYPYAYAAQLIYRSYRARYWRAYSC